MSIKSVAAFALVCAAIIAAVDYERQSRDPFGQWQDLSVGDYVSSVRLRFGQADETHTVPRDPLHSGQTRPGHAQATRSQTTGPRIAAHLPQTGLAPADERAGLIGSMVSAAGSGVARNMPAVQDDLFQSVKGLLGSDDAAPARRSGQAFGNGSTGRSVGICIRRGSTLSCD